MQHVVASFKRRHVLGECCSSDYWSFLPCSGRLRTPLPPPDTEEFWTNALLVLDFSFDVKFYNNPGPNQASVRYIQTVTTFDAAGFPDGMGGTSPPIIDYPFSQTFYQHEDALIAVDDDCKLVTWDQYGDDKEQTDVAEANSALLCAIGAAPCPPS